ncbi:MAG TPA: hypothetical protein VG015_00670, partial [Candidatus Dormibacteraeota bacterium]|nr:hypothetical protein [Candidatus Dormibacteraeota bacterium]
MTVPRTPDPPERVGEITAPQGKRIPLSVWAGLVVGALALRLANLGASPYGDEAYYFFVTRHLSAWWDTRTFPISGSVFPIFPLFFHWFAGSLSELRVANAVVGAMAVPLGMAVLRSVGVGRRLSVAGGAFLAIDLILVQFSALAFLDMLGAILALGAVLADVRGHRGAASTLVLLAALEKEFYALLGIALLVEHLISRRSIYWEMLIAAGVFWLWVAIRYLALHAS